MSSVNINSNNSPIFFATQMKKAQKQEEQNIGEKDFLETSLQDINEDNENQEILMNEMNASAIYAKAALLATGSGTASKGSSSAKEKTYSGWSSISPDSVKKNLNNISEEIENLLSGKLKGKGVKLSSDGTTLTLSQKDSTGKITKKNIKLTNILNFGDYKLSEDKTALKNLTVQATDTGRLIFKTQDKNNKERSISFDDLTDCGSYTYKIETSGISDNTETTKVQTYKVKNGVIPEKPKTTTTTSNVSEASSSSKSGAKTTSTNYKAVTSVKDASLIQDSKFKASVEKVAKKIKNATLRRCFYQAMTFIDEMSRTAKNTKGDSSSGAFINKNAAKKMMDYINNNCNSIKIEAKNTTAYSGIYNGNNSICISSLRFDDEVVANGKNYGSDVTVAKLVLHELTHGMCDYNGYNSYDELITSLFEYSYYKYAINSTSYRTIGDMSSNLKKSGKTVTTKAYNFCAAG